MNATYAKKVFGFIILTMILAGCAQTPPNVKPVSKTEHHAALIDQLGQDLDKAKRERVNLLSPQWFADAQSSYQLAKTGLSKGTQLSSISENIALGRAQLSQAIIFKNKSSKRLADVIKSRDAAYKAGANKYTKEFGKLEAAFLKLTRAIEKGNMGYINSKKKTVNSQYRDLELRAIKDTNLATARRLVQTAQSRDMDDSAPKSFAMAQGKLAKADTVITKNRYDKTAIDAAVKAAEFYGKRLHHIAGVSTKLEDMEPEDIALWMEGFLKQTNTQLKERDHRNLAFKSQQEIILNGITSLQRNRSSVSDQVQAKEMEINTLKRRIADLEGRTHQERTDKERIAAERERLAAEKRFNELYNKVQKYFSADQAEVYKKSQHLVIRLKAMQFPVGQSVIIPSNYPLLTTVQKAIHAFGKPNVVIEGHSDSTGSEALNQKLSQDRAESVRQYFIHNGVLPENQITSAGYGSSRPLASNATAGGRAINRRIDIIIKPGKK